MLRILRSLSLVLACAAVFAPAAAHAAPVAKTAKKATKKTVKYPTIASIAPRKLAVGQKLTIKGAHFRPGKSSVAFYKSGKPVVFVKADTSTTTTLVVTVPEKLINLLTESNGSRVPTLLRLRVVGTKMGRAWTKNSRSPVVSAVAPAPAATAAPAPTAAAPVAGATEEVQKYLTCQQNAAAAPAVDGDADGIANGIELAYKLDPCLADTDADGMIDGYEYWSAIDLNGTAVPYPGKRPWPNPLDPSDPQYDFDGDGLRQWQENELWRNTKSGFPLVAYSDGTQNSGGSQASISTAQQYLDLDQDGNLTDDERDFDKDGLSNMVEYNYTGTQSWWKDGPYGKTEKPYVLRSFTDPQPLEPDTDGDGILDGADDQDNDGWSNFLEMELARDRLGYRAQPFNPCLPDANAATCSRWLIVNVDPWPPFDGSEAPDNPYTSVDDNAASPVPFGWPHVSWGDYQAYITAHPGDDATLLGTIWGPWNFATWFSGTWDGTGGPQGP